MEKNALLSSLENKLADGLEYLLQGKPSTEYPSSQR
jgi:hypothetical protein